MSVNAHTNLPGNHYLDDFTTSVTEGWSYLRNDFRDTRQTSYTKAESIKSLTVRGDRKSNYPYRRQVSRLIANDPIVTRRLAVNSTNGFVSERSVTKRYISEFRSIQGMFLPPRLEVLAADKTAASTTKVLNKLGSAKIEAAVELAEIKTTADMLARASIRALEFYKAVRRGAYKQIPFLLGLSKDGLKSGKDPASLWLQYQYGWKPLVSTVYDAYHSLNDLLERGVVIYGKSTNKWKDSFSYQDGEFDCDVSANGGTTLFIAARVQNEYLANANRLGLANPLSVAWELLPFSFVADWFVPVGNVLSGLSDTFGLDFISGYRTEFWELSETKRLRASTVPYGDSIDSRGRWTAASSYTRRYPLYGFPLPEFYTKDNPFTSTHTVSALALIRQLY